MMNADYLIVASISSFGTEKKKFKGYGVETVTLVTNLRASYKILEGSQGSALAADTIVASKSERFTVVKMGHILIRDFKKYGRVHVKMGCLGV